MRFTAVFIIFALVLSSCKKAEDRSCFKGIGEEVSKEIPLGSFQSIFLGAHLDYVLVQDNVEKVIITGGKNVVNFIGTDIENGKLSITNNNKCNFLRSYKKSITVEIHLVDINKIEFEGTKPVICKNQLTCPKILVIIKDGAGEFNLNINNDELKCNISNGWGNMNVSGMTKYAKMNVTSNGFFDAYGLTVQDSIHVISYTPGTSKVNINNALFRSEIGSSGDIWYKGIPTLIDNNQIGTGELINKN